MAEGRSRSSCHARFEPPPSRLPRSTFQDPIPRSVHRPWAMAHRFAVACLPCACAGPTGDRDRCSRGRASSPLKSQPSAAVCDDAIPPAGWGEYGNPGVEAFGAPALRVVYCTAANTARTVPYASDRVLRWCLLLASTDRSGQAV